MPNDKNHDIEAFASAISLLVRKLRSNSPAELKEFSWTQRTVLSRLEKNGPATSADLARSEGITPQSMGTAISQLEKLGFVERKPHPTDGRQVFIKITTKGASLVRQTRQIKHDWLGQSIVRLDKQEQATLFKASNVIMKLVSEE